MNKQKKIIGGGKWIQVVDVDSWEYAERIVGTNVIAIVACNGSKLILTEQHRMPVETTVIELPAGLVGDLPEDPDESLESAARRELFEETGYEAEAITFLTAGPCSAGLSNEVIHFFLATGLRKIGDGGGDDSENIVVHEIELHNLNSWLDSCLQRGALVDPKIYIGLHFLRERGLP